MEKIRILVVEDDPNIGDTYEMYLDDLNYELISIADNSVDALRLATATSPDLIIVDVKIKGELDGIQLVESIDQDRPMPVIFVTAMKDDETFQRAKETSPYAYLIKPFDKETLQRTIELALMKFAENQEQVIAANGYSIIFDDSFFVKERGKLLKIRFEDIQWVEVEEKYCNVHTQSRKFVIRTSLKELLLKLPKEFIQTHRKYVVNYSKIESIDIENFCLTMGSIEIPMGKAFKETLIKRIDLI